MAAPTVQFVYVALMNKTGYQWVSRNALEIIGHEAADLGPEDMFIAPKFDPGERKVFREIELPADFFLTMAGLLEPTQESILQFVNKFGSLENRYVVILRDLIPQNASAQEKSTAAVHADMFIDWVAFILRL